VTREIYPDGSVPTHNLVAAFDEQRAPRHTPSMVVGVVMAVHTTDEEVMRLGRGVEVDVILYGIGGRPLFNVPVRQTGGYRNADLWEPSPTTKNIRTGDAVSWDAMLAGQETGRYNSLADLDGDHVTIEYVGNSVDSPLVTGAMPHPAAIAKPTRATGDLPDSGALPTSPTSPARYLRHQGSVVMVDRRGNVVVDTTAAPKDNSGDEPSGGGAAGHVAVNLRAGGRLQILLDGTEWFSVKDGEVLIGSGATKAAARKTDAVQVGGTAIPPSGDAAWAKWVSLAHTILTELGASILPPAGPIQMPESPPLTIDGTITEGSDKVMEG